MYKGSKRNRIRRDDYCRVLVTETTPYETPIIFSNDGIYNRVYDINSAGVVQKELLKGLIFGKEKGNPPTVPYSYKIRKNAMEYRRLALIHPRSQWEIKGFYQRYEDLILFHCQVSSASIRAPQKVAGSYFFKNSSDKLNQYRKDGVSLIKLDEMTKHSPSFFTYRGYDRLYKFFESKDYFSLEKRHSHMLSLDVSKCFDSIYTHSISWAVKDKEFTKKHKSIKSTFGQRFDSLMQNSNHGETNGIVIGPEISRIFAEIIFQEVDRRAISRIDRKEKFRFGKEYTFRRYVDDIFIFSSSSEIAKSVYSHYADTLLEFNLHTNPSKSELRHRPFATKKSILINSASIEANSFIEKFLDSDVSGECLVPREIKSSWALSNSFIQVVKNLCAKNEATYDDVSGYLISVLNERIKKIASVQSAKKDDGFDRVYQDAIRVILEVIFFLYQVSPSVNASYKVGTSVILAIRFFRKHYPSLEKSINQLIYELTDDLISNLLSTSPLPVDRFLPLEVLNVLLASRELGSEFLFSPTKVNDLFIKNKEDSYFNIISCLFYVRDEPAYADVRDEILKAADRMLFDLSDIDVSSEKAHLLLDLLSSPFVSKKKKKDWTTRAFKALSIKSPSKIEMEEFLKSPSLMSTSVNWDEVDLLNSLEKKELKRAY